MSSITLDSNGVSSLVFDMNPGLNWINRNGSSWAIDAEMRPPGVFNTYASPTSKTLVSPTQLHYVYPSWDLVFNVAANSDGSVSISGVLTNNSTSSLVAQVNLCKLNFPKGPYNFGTLTAIPTPYNVNCADSPGFMGFEVGATVGAEVWMCEDQLGTDGTVSLASPNWGGYTLSVSGDQGNPTPAGGTFVFNFKLRCLGSDAAESTEVQNLASLFAINHPQLVYWYDRRPVGQVIFTGGAKSTDISSGPNPRNWFNDQTGNTTVSNAGAKLISYAQSAISNCVSRNYQGMILWDCEGAEWPQGLVTYGGDPRLLDPAANPFGISFAPEMNAVIDQIVADILAAGLKVGFCLRMNTLAKYSQYPVNSYSPYVQNPFPDSQTAINDLAARVNYCQKRWGPQCRLYYVDSAGQAPAGIGGSGLNNYGIWQALQAMFHNCFFAPEQNVLINFKSASVYRENRGGSNGPSPLELEVYPQGFVLLNLANYNSSSRSAVLNAIVAGNVIPMTECWWVSPEMTWLDGIITDAKSAGWSGFQTTKAQNMSLLTDIQNAQTAVAQAVTDLTAVSTAAGKVSTDATQLSTDLQQLQTDLKALSTAAESADLTNVTNALSQARTDLGA